MFVFLSTGRYKPEDTLDSLFFIVFDHLWTRTLAENINYKLYLIMIMKIVVTGKILPTADKFCIKSYKYSEKSWSLGSVLGPSRDSNRRGCFVLVRKFKWNWEFVFPKWMHFMTHNVEVRSQGNSGHCLRGIRSCLNSWTSDLPIQTM